jgi:murein DD-endopeptidase MepM/ murein hydrolase activator NlpD
MNIHLPISKRRVTLPFASIKSPYSPGNPHRGVDMSPYPGALGEPVYAWCGGKVKATGDHPTAGRYIIYTSALQRKVSVMALGGGQAIQLEQGALLETHYYHLQDIYVSAGTSFDAGDTVGTIGSTGTSTGPHLHWEVRLPDNVRIDPLALFDELAKEPTTERARFILEVYGSDHALLFDTNELVYASVNGEPLEGLGGKLQVRFVKGG